MAVFSDDVERRTRLKSSRSALVICALFLIAANTLRARADAPLPTNSVWVDINVQTCSAATFPAPRDTPHYVVERNHRTAVITGTVVRSGFDGPAANPQDEARRSRALPAPKSSVTYALREWDDRVCGQIGVGVRRFRFTYDCDAGPSQGRCFSPFPLVIPDSGPPR